MNDHRVTLLIRLHIISILCITQLNVLSLCFYSQGFMFVFSQDLVIWLQSIPFSKELKLKIKKHHHQYTEICRYLGKQKSYFDLLVKEVLVHNSWNVKQGISHPKECVFTVWRQKTYCITETPTQQLWMTRGNKQSAVIQHIICFGFARLNGWNFD